VSATTVSTRADLADLLWQLLSDGVPQAQGRVHAGRAWPVPGEGNDAGYQPMPAILLYLDYRRRRSKSGPNAVPTYETVFTATIIARAEGGSEAEVEATLDAISEAIDAALFREGSLLAVCEDIREMETRRKIEGQGERHVGQDGHAVDLVFTEGFEPAEARLSPFTSVRVRVDAIDPADPAGNYGTTPPWPAPAAPPRESGPDGRAEAELHLTIPQS
jgi:hypothetical protein